MIRFYDVLRRGDDRGFTLIELLIVVAVIAILAVIAIPNFLNARKKATLSATKANLKNISTALETYQADNDSYPYAAAVDTATTLNTSNPIGIVPTYLGRWPTDPVGGGNYVYYNDGTGLGTAQEYQVRDPHLGNSDVHRNGSGASASAYIEEGGNVQETSAGTWPTAPQNP